MKTYWLTHTDISYGAADGWKKFTIVWTGTIESFDKTYRINNDSRENGSSDRGPVVRVLLSTQECVVIALEESADDREDDDGKYWDDDAIAPVRNWWKTKARQESIRARTKTKLAWLLRRASSCWWSLFYERIDANREKWTLWGSW